MTETAALLGRPAAGAAGDGGYGFGLADKGSPFMVSGELFLRSTQSLLFNGGGDDRVGASSHEGESTETSASAAAAAAAAARHPSAALLAGLSPDLRDLLLCHPDVSASELSATNGADGGLRGLVSSARAARLAIRRKRVEYLTTSKAMAACLATARLSAVHRAGDGFRERCAQGNARLDSRLRNLVLRFASAVSAEMAAEDAQTAAEEWYCRRETERLELAARLASLAATAEHRTRGSVVLRRLPPTHPQHARCLRAATENVKPGFFSSESPYGAVQVLDIYKIENRVLLERFQRAAETVGPCKVKGLFCRVPDESLEHVVLYGMGGAGVLMDDGGVGDGPGGNAASFTVTGWDGDPIDFFGDEGGGVGGVTKFAARGGGRRKSTAERRDSHGGGDKRPLEFPRAFSRHSTLQEEHGYANSRRGCDVDDNDEEEYTGERGVRRHRRPCSPPGWRRRDAKDGAAAKDRRRRTAVSGLRFLALCRVMIGSMHVATVPSPEAAAQLECRAGGGEGASGERGGGTSLSQGSRSPPDTTSSSAEEHLQGVHSCPASSCSSPCSPCSSVAGPGVLRPFSLPPPPPGHAEFDSVYFPREEEYRLLNEAYVLPEFLVVHRFVAATMPLGNTDHGARGSAPAAVSTTNPAAAASAATGADVSVGKGEENCHQQAAVGVASAGSGGGGGGAKKAAEKRGERGRQQPWHPQQHGHSKGGLAPPPTQDAASVVAEIEAAMESMALPEESDGPPQSGGGGGGGSVPREATAAPFSGGGDSACSLSSEVGAAYPNGSSEGGDQGEDRGRQRGSGRAVRDSIASDVVLEFECHWQDMGRLRELERSEVAKTALSRRRLRQPGGLKLTQQKNMPP
eukprot:g5934.t1